VLHPNALWIEPIVKQKSIRMLCLGGSNTAHNFGYTAYLKKNLMQLFPSSTSESYLIERGVPGVGPVLTNYHFEE
jgi:hypothetical protein